MGGRGRREGERISILCELGEASEKLGEEGEEEWREVGGVGTTWFQYQRP